MTRRPRVAAFAWLVAIAALWAGAPAAAEFKPWTGPTPELRVADLQGREHRLADYRGKVVLVNFWATWCAPCREEMPSMARLGRALGARPFAVLAVNLGEKASRIENFLAETKLDLPVVLDPDMSAAAAWKVRYLPASFLVDGAGRARYAVYGAVDWTGPEARGKVLELLGGLPRTAFESALRDSRD